MGCYTRNLYHMVNENILVKNKEKKYVVSYRENSKFPPTLIAA